jgi:pimeloyl-ACP methyl ester carboxylesterase
MSSIEHPTSASAPLVFLHGSGDSARAWEPLIARLPGYDTLALNLPGHGDRLDRPGPSVMSIADYADAVRAALTRRGLAGVTLGGHSLGAAVALHMALEYPALIGRIVLIGAGARLRVLPQILEGARSGSREAQRELVRMSFAPEHATQAEAYFAALEPLAPGVFGRDLSACDAFDMMADLGRIEQPALIITGEADRATPPKYATYLRDHLENAHLVLVPNAGHYAHIEVPDAVAAAIKEWLG